MKKFAGLLTAGLVAATLTACNDKEANKSDATKAQAPANDTVYLYTWTEYVPDGLLAVSYTHLTLPTNREV